MSGTQSLAPSWPPSLSEVATAIADNPTGAEVAPGLYLGDVSAVEGRPEFGTIIGLAPSEPHPKTTKVYKSVSQDNTVDILSQIITARWSDSEDLSGAPVLVYSDSPDDLAASFVAGALGIHYTIPYIDALEQIQEFFPADPSPEIRQLVATEVTPRIRPE